MCFKQELTGDLLLEHFGYDLRISTKVNAKNLALLLVNILKTHPCTIFGVNQKSSFLGAA